MTVVRQRLLGNIWRGSKQDNKLLACRLRGMEFVFIESERWGRMQNLQTISKTTYRVDSRLFSGLIVLEVDLKPGYKSGNPK